MPLYSLGSSFAVALFVFSGCAPDEGSYDDPMPVAHDDVVMLDEDEPLSLQTLAANDDNVHHVTVIAPPVHGTIVEGRYLPQPGYFGPDRFTYEGRYSRYGTAATATVDITIASDGIAFERSRLLAETEACDVASGDLDGDGAIDIVTCDTSRNELVVFRNTTSGEHAYALHPYRFEGGSLPVRLVIADLDGDGRLDVVTAAYEGLAVFRNLTVPGGPPAFAAPFRLGTMITQGVAVADLDGDGAPDLAATESPSSTADGKLHVWLNLSTEGSFTFGTQTTFATPPSPGRLLTVAVDGDARDDLFVLARDKLSLFVNATSGGAAVAAFQARIDRDTAQNARDMFLVDLDGDARSEIGVLHAGSQLWVYANRSTEPSAPSFEAARVLDLPASVTLVAPAELDGDGVIDLLGASRGKASFAHLHNRSVSQAYAFDVAEATIADVATRAAASFAIPRAIAFVDLDGVPPLEIIVASTSESGTGGGAGGLRVLYGP